MTTQATATSTNEVKWGYDSTRVGKSDQAQSQSAKASDATQTQNSSTQLNTQVNRVRDEGSKIQDRLKESGNLESQNEILKEVAFMAQRIESGDVSGAVAKSFQTKIDSLLETTDSNGERLFSDATIKALQNPNSDTNSTATVTAASANTLMEQNNTRMSELKDSILSTDSLSTNEAAQKQTLADLYFNEEGMSLANQIKQALDFMKMSLGNVNQQQTLNLLR